MPSGLVAILCVHPPSAPATRFRVVQYLPHLRMAADISVWTFLREQDLSRWYSSGTLGKMFLIARSMPRLVGAVALILRADLVLIQREAVPAGPPLLEWIASRFSTLVWDVDDAVWAQHEDPELSRLLRWLRSPSRKFESIATWAVEIWAGSEVLAGWCRTRNRRVWTLPTVVQVPESPPPGSRARTAIWIGSPSTAQFLEAVLPALEGMPDAPEVLAVGTEDVEPREKLEVRAWSPEAEAAALRIGRIGLYPVDAAHPMADGKCGLKALLYMAHGVPPVVTPTPTNATIVRAGVDGLHAETSEQWRDAVARLLADDELWTSCRERGYQRVKSDYSVEAWGPRVADRLRGLLAEQHR